MKWKSFSTFKETTGGKDEYFINGQVLLNEEKVGYSSYVLCRDMVKVIDGYSG